MNKIYIYDNNFISLISLIKYLIKNNIIPYNIKNKFYEANLLESVIYFKPDNNINDLLNTIGKENLKIIYYVFLSNEEDKEILIYYYVLNALKYKEKTIYLRNINCVSKSLKIHKRVSREAHKFKGFTRFKEINNNILYADINPDNNIIMILSKHFQNRLQNEYWIIKDVNRNIISFYDKKKLIIINGNLINLNLILSSEELNYSNLWKEFYKTISIKERKNERSRMNFMPKKYWQYIAEVIDEKSNK